MHVGLASILRCWRVRLLSSVPLIAKLILHPRESGFTCYGTGRDPCRLRRDSTQRQ